MALTGEDEATLKARILYGEPEVSEDLRQVIYRDFFFHRMSNEQKESLKARLAKVLEETKDANLPDDLDFIRRMIKLGVSILDGEAKVSDFIMISKIYADLWLEERKPEGLERIVTRLWGSAGRIDMDLR